MAAFVAEFIGTFALIFIGAGSIIVSPTSPGVMGTLLGIALAHGLTIAVMGSATGHVSGGHLNPAVTIGMLVTGRIEASKAAGYIVSQVLGAVAAAAILSATMTPAAVQAVKLGTPLIGTNADGTLVVGVLAAVVLEAIATFFLMFVIFGTAVDKRGPSMGALFIGFTVALDILAIGPLTGAAMNPARSFGPMLVGNHWDNFWVYWLGPIIGAVTAALVYQNVLLKRDNT